MSTWHKVADWAAIPEDTLFPVPCEGRDWVLLRRGEEVRGFLDRCSHQDVKLSEFGHLDRGTIVCFAHGARFDEWDGAPLCWPASEGLECVVTKVEAGSVYLKL